MAGGKRIGADIGGTFTDVAALAPDGRLHIGKRLTTHGSEGDGVLAALADTDVDLAGPDTILAHGTTLVINALLERKGAKVGLVVTKGFPDIIEGGRSSRPEIFNVTYRRDPVIVPPEMRFEIAERISGSGEILERPDEGELDALVRALEAAEVDAIAVGLLNSYREPANEELVSAHLRAALPDVTVTASTELSRQWRETERFTTAAANAYVAPVADRYVERLLDGLRTDGFDGEFVVLDSNGGALSVAAARRFPIRTVESGPVAGVLGARELAAHLGIANMVTFDMGGTTAKSCLIEEGHYASTELYWINGYERGFALQVRCVDVTEVGAGGGSIAWLDEGRLRVGPRSAGSQPGPACYGGGGTEPTVTDADLFCGRIDADNFVGSLELDAGAATEAIEQLAEAAGMPPHRLALGIIKLANLSMASVVRRQTLERGRDPREFTMVAFGGAGPMHACEVAQEVGIRQVLIPRFPGHFSAIGMLGVNLRLDRREIVNEPIGQLDLDRLRERLAAIADDLSAELTIAGPAQGPIEVHYAFALRYHGQNHMLLIDGPEEGVSDDLPAQLQQQFETEYLRRYGHLDALSAVDVVEVEVAVQCVLPRITVREQEHTVPAPSTVTSYFGLEGSPVTSTTLPRSSLKVNDTVEGPAVIYEEGSTIVLPPGSVATVVEGGSLLVDLSEALREGEPDER